MPGNLTLISDTPYPEGWVLRNQETNRRSDVPRLGDIRATVPALAVVGSSPGVTQHLDTLRAWDGDIWAVNAAHRFLAGEGIEASFYTIDASEVIAEWAAGAKHAILGDTVCPAVFDAVDTAEMTVLDGSTPFGCSSACCAPVFAALKGYEHVTFFGCESSFGETTHVDRDEDCGILLIECGGDIYRTNPGMLMQAETLSEIIRAAPRFLSVAGGGLLRAMVVHGKFECTHMSRSLHDQLQPAPKENGENHAS